MNYFSGTMICIKDERTNPYFNLAAEEYLLKNFEDEYFLLWRNEPSIIVGKHQNSLAEINLDYVLENQIKVARRISGGGAVFHDLGNLNFTFITNGDDGNLIDFKRFTRPIIEVLQSMGVNAEFGGRNDLLIDGKKFSGNASHVYKNRVLHHGTILYSSLMGDLSRALKVNPLKFKDKAVKSVRSRVTNIKEHLQEDMDVLTFRDRIMEHIQASRENSRIHSYSEKDVQVIEKARDEKFSTWEWNFGYSPNYQFEKGIRTEGGTVEVRMNVHKGLITEIRLQGDFFNKKDVSDLEQMLTGVEHDPQRISDTLNGVDVSTYLVNVKKEELIGGMF